jgi:acetolactate synthase-1/2/3 large subunit
MRSARPRESPCCRATAAPDAGALDVATLGQAVAALQPEGAIIVDEAATSGAVWFALAGSAPRHTVLGLTGGAIGQGLPAAVGAAIACPQRKVIALQADGSGMYTAQALWTMAREQLDVVVVLCANRAYRILQLEVARAGIAEPGPAARGLTELSNPTSTVRSRAAWCRPRATDGLAWSSRRRRAGPALIEAQREVIDVRLFAPIRALRLAL